MSNTVYEWMIKTVDPEDDNFSDLDFEKKLIDFKHSLPEVDGKNKVLYLVKTVHPDGSGTDREWAKVDPKEGLPDHFLCAFDLPASKVPKRFQNEYIANCARIGSKLSDTPAHKFINWSEVSRELTGDRTQIRANYSGAKYKPQIDLLIKAVERWKTEKGFI